MIQGRGNNLRYRTSGLLNETYFEVGISRGGLHLRMAQQSPDHGQVRTKLERI